MFTFENRVGRLIEFTMGTPLTVGEIDTFQAEALRVLTKIPGPTIVCSDFRRMNVMPQEVTDRLLGIMKAVNPKVERNGFWVLPTAMFALQAERILREGGNPGRRSFRERAPLEAWLGEVLTPAERARMNAYLTASGTIL